jgi:hypothetical protein
MQFEGVQLWTSNTLLFFIPYPANVENMVSS